MDYLSGVDLLGAVAVPPGTGRDLDASIRALAAGRPMSAREGHDLIALALAALNRREAEDGEWGADWRSDLCRQLTNIDQSISTSGADPIPNAAASILSEAALLVVADAGAAEEVLGARTKQTTVLGADARDWDNTQTFEVGDVARYWGNWYRAVRRVTPPMFPSIQSGDVPGKSDAWVQMSAAEVVRGEEVGHGGGGGHGGGHGHGGGGRGGWGGGAGRWFGYYPYLYDVDYADDVDVDDLLVASSASELLGAYDIVSAQHQMNALQQVSVRAAQALIKGGQSAINHAIEIAYERGLPGPTERKNVQAHLQWHADALSKVSNTPNAMYASGDDLKKYVMMAFVDNNAVEEGAAYLDQIWDQMWHEIGAALAALPQKVLDQAAWYTKVTFWTIIGGTALLAYGGYKLLSSDVGGRVANHYVPWR